MQAKSYSSIINASYLSLDIILYNFSVRSSRSTSRVLSLWFEFGPNNREANDAIINAISNLTLVPTVVQNTRENVEGTHCLTFGCTFEPETKRKNMTLDVSQKSGRRQFNVKLLDHFRPFIYQIASRVERSVEASNAEKASLQHTRYQESLELVLQALVSITVKTHETC